MDMPVSYTTTMRHLAQSTIALLDQLDKFRPLIEEAMEYGTYTHSFDDLTKMVLERKLIFWHWDDAFMMATVHEYPKAKHYHLFLAGGNLETLLAAQDQVIRAAQDAGCDRLTLNGRPGWARVFRDAKQAHVMLAMEVPKNG